MVRQRCLHPGLPAEWWAGALRSMNNTAFWPKREERKLQSARWPVLLLSLPPPLSHVPLHPLLPPSVNRKVQQAGQGPFPRGSISWTSLPTLSFSVWKQRLAERISFGMTTAWWHLSVLCSPPPTHTHTLPGPFSIHLSSHPCQCASALGPLAYTRLHKPTHTHTV